MGAAVRTVLWVATVVALVVGAGATSALAHEERASTFPSGMGTTPTYRAFAEGTPRLVVCKPESRALVARIADPRLRALNTLLLQECGFAHIQAAVDAVSTQGTNIYVLPGTYREEPSHNPPCVRDYDGGVVDYPLMVSCGEVINLVTVAGDSPTDADIACDNVLCDLQIEGTGARMEDTVVRGGFSEDGDWVKHNGLKADRADGFYLRNMTFELFRETAVYVHETDGYGLDRINARHNDLYGILTFTSDHGLITDCDTSFNGDSGIYPGSSADVNANRAKAGPLSRYALEIRRCRTHHNALGFSGAAGNSVWFHHNAVFANGAGYVTDSFVPDHPGSPQDSAWLTGNRIFGNNSNYYERFVHSGTCDRPPAQRGYGKGTVCPAFLVPVGTGVLIAGGNRNLVEKNAIYDNWRAGAMLFWVPGAIRGDYGPHEQTDTSHGNEYRANRLGFHPSGVTQPNGVDFSWDEQGIGNCWQDNVSATGDVTSDTVLPSLPRCDTGGSLSPVGNVVKGASIVSCATYNREDMKDPPGCNWADSPPPPKGRQAAPGEDAAPAPAPDARLAPPGLTSPVPPAAAPGQRAGLPATGAPALPAAAAAVLAAAAWALRRRRRVIGHP